jgi:hypothetical protein
MRFALKCFPAEAALRVVGGELLRAPRRPTSAAHAFARIVVELPQIIRSRRSLAHRTEHLQRVLSGSLESR